MALPNRRNTLAAGLLAGAAVTALVGIAVDADGRLFGRGSSAAPVAVPMVDELADPAADTAAARAEFDSASLGSAFEVDARTGGVTATRDDTTVTVLRDGVAPVTVNLNREQTYLVTGAAHWFVGADKPVAVFSGRDRRVQPIR